MNPPSRRLRSPRLFICWAIAMLAPCAGAAPISKGAGSDLDASKLDPSAYESWEGGQTQLLATDGRGPGDYLWTKVSEPRPGWLTFGDSKVAGPRHLRIGFRSSVRVGTVLTLGNVRLSVLKPGAGYPGDMSDERQWLPAERVSAGGVVSSEVGDGDYALWVLPAGTSTRAIRFTHDAQQTDLHYLGRVGGVVIFPERFDNAAMRAVASAGSKNSDADKINNGSNDGVWKTWANLGKGEEASGSDEWVVLAWPEPVAVDGLLALGAGFSKATVEVYTGPDDRNPRYGVEADWQKIDDFTGVTNGHPILLWPNRMGFGKTVTTRGVRVRIAADAKNAGRVTLGELMALSPIGSESLAAVVSRQAQGGSKHPPIPVRFHLNEPGYVTLVIERPDGFRVRNLVADTFFPAGDNVVWWDGTDDLDRDVDAAMHGVYHIPGRFVEPGEYRVRGLTRKKIEPIYEFSVYVSGNPPWNTADSTGAWLANHTPPQAALFVPAERSPIGEPTMYLGCYVTEGPAGLAWVDMDGNKRGGKRWVGGHWTAAPFLTDDPGRDASKERFAYVASVWKVDNDSDANELRVTALTHGKDEPIIKYRLAELSEEAKLSSNVASSKGDAEVAGLAVYNQLIVVSMKAKNELLFIDGKTGTVVGSQPLESPRGSAFDAQGRFYVLSGDKVVRFAGVSDSGELPRPEPIIRGGLDDPYGLLLDKNGDIYVSQRGQSHQVKVFRADGGFIRNIGHAGAPASGPYDPLQMNRPAGMAIDSLGRLWVTEQDFLPKRVSVWSKDGRLLRAFYGPGKYGGGGTLDDHDKTKFYYADDSHGGMEFKIDWEKGGFELASVYYRRTPDDMVLPFRSAGPERPLYHQGRRYFTNCYNSSPTGGSATAFVFVERDGVVVPAAGMGRAVDWDILKTEPFRERWPEGVDLNQKGPRADALFVWSDTNRDAHVQPAEVTLQKAITGGVTVMPDLSFCISRVDDQAMRYPPASIGTDGLPAYDLSQGKVLATGVQRPGSSGGDQVLVSPNGWTEITLGFGPFHRFSVGGLKDGEPRWSYPSPWPGLHASHRAPRPDRPGQLIGSTRVLGGFFNAGKSDAGPFWALHTNHGRVSIFTEDGLLAATVFDDMRGGKIWRMPSASRGMSLDGVTLGEENFWPTISGTPDGKVYMVDGARSALVRLDGMDTIRRLPSRPMSVSKADIDLSRAWQIEAEAERQRNRGSGVLQAALRSDAPAVDGSVGEWNPADWVEIDSRGVAAYFSSTSKPYDVSGAVAVAGDRLYAAWRTGDDKLLQNSGEMEMAPFKTGGALDLMIGANPVAPADRRLPVHGDCRLLVTVVDGKPKALLYRAVVPGTRETDRVPFSSPWRTIKFDRVDDVSSEVTFAAAGGNYEISIPLSTLLLRPKPDMVIKGDIGILRGNGTETTARIYWNNKATGIVSDVPDEAMLTPSLWGEFKFITR